MLACVALSLCECGNMQLPEFIDLAYAQLMRSGVPSDTDLNQYWSTFSRNGVPVHLVVGNDSRISLAREGTFVSRVLVPMSPAHQQSYFTDLTGRLDAYAKLIEGNAQRCPSYRKPGLDLEIAAEMAAEAFVSSFSAAGIRESYRSELEKALSGNQRSPIDAETLASARDLGL